MFAHKLVSGSSNLLLGSSAILLAATPVIKLQESPNVQDDSDKVICKPSELPIYPSRVSTFTKIKVDEPGEVEKFLLEPVGAVRAGVIGILKDAKDLSSKAGDSISESADKFKFIVTYLREEDNEAQRVGAVVMGTLTGLIFGLRDGFIKKITYSLIGTGAMGAVCFPEQTNKYVSEGVTQGKLLTNIVYNFVYGVKPGDPQAEIQFPEISMPKNFDDVVSMVTSLSKSAKDAIMPPSTPQEASKPEDVKKE